MAIVIDGSANTIAGLAVGGLPDGSVDTDTLAANAVATAKIADDAVTAAKSTISPGITHLETWLLTSSKNWSGTNTFTDLVRTTNADFGNFGAAMTMDGSTGIFTFPTTGIWHIHYQALVHDSVPNAYSWIWIDKTTDNGSNWSTLGESSNSIPDDGDNTVHGSPQMDVTFDVQNTTNYKVVFKIANEQGAVIGAGSSTLKTGIIFTRIGDT